MDVTVKQDDAQHARACVVLQRQRALIVVRWQKVTRCSTPDKQLGSSPYVSGCAIKHEILHQ